MTCKTSWDWLQLPRTSKDKWNRWWMEVHRSQGDVSNKIYLVCSNKHQILTFKRLEADDVTWVFWEIHLFAFELDGKIYSTLVFVHKVWSLVGFRILLLLVDRHSNVRCREMDLRPFNYRIVGLIVRPPCCQNTCTFSHIIHQHLVISPFVNVPDPEQPLHNSKPFWERYW